MSSGVVGRRWGWDFCPRLDASAGMGGCRNIFHGRFSNRHLVVLMTAGLGLFSPLRRRKWTTSPSGIFICPGASGGHIRHPCPRRREPSQGPIVDRGAPSMCMMSARVGTESSHDRTSPIAPCGGLWTALEGLEGASVDPTVQPAGSPWRASWGSSGTVLIAAEQAGIVVPNVLPAARLPESLLGPVHFDRPVVDEPVPGPEKVGQGLRDGLVEVVWSIPYPRLRGMLTAHSIAVLSKAPGTKRWRYGAIAERTFASSAKMAGSPHETDYKAR